jgi:hypothetical protein
VLLAEPGEEALEAEPIAAVRGRAVPGFQVSKRKIIVQVVLLAKRLG